MRSPDIHVVRDSGFLDLLEPFDQVMADRQNDLALKQCSLSIPPSAGKCSQILKKVSTATSLFTNIE